MAPDVELRPVHDGDGLGWLRADWSIVEAGGGADRHPGRTAAWTASWTASHAHGPLLGVRVGPPGAPLAVGLIEVRPARRWAFAGRGVSTSRGLVCRPGSDNEAWAALRARLRAEARRLTELDAEDEVPALLGPRPTVHTTPAYGLPDLPASLDLLLARRSKNSRRQLGKKLRRFEAAGGELVRVPAAERAPALHRLVELHQRRAASLGERHHSVDDRLAHLLEGLAADPVAPAVRVFEARVRGRVLASGVRVDHAGNGCYLQVGLDPGAIDLAPGVCVTLEVLADACERGLRSVDLGPGEFRYKRDVGGVPHAHRRVIAPSRSLGGALLRLTREAAKRAPQASTGSRRGVPSPSDASSSTA